MYELIVQVITHLVAFLLLLWLFKKYLWVPVLGVLDERRQAIEGRLAEAEKRIQEGTNIRQQYQEKLASADEEIRQLRQEEMQRTKEMAAGLRQEAQETISRERHAFQERMESELDSARRELRGYVADLGVRLAEQILQEKMDDQTRSRVLDKMLPDLERETGAAQN